MAVADRHSERVGGVIGLRNFFEIEDYPRHLLHLLLFGASVTDDALFDLLGKKIPCMASIYPTKEEAKKSSVVGFDYVDTVKIEWEE